MALEVAESSEVAMADDVLYMEVEDIMCDQGIITAELNVDFQSESSRSALSATRLRVAVSVIARTVLPAVVDVYYAYIRNQKTVVNNVRHQLLPTVLAFLANSISRSLASVQRGITFPLSLRAIKQESSQPIHAIDDEFPEKSVECTILSEPGLQEETIADIIFIHGLHGGLDKTWKQGEWKMEGKHVKRDPMDRSPSEGDLHVPSWPRRMSLKRAVSDVSDALPSKIARTKSSQGIGREESQEDAAEEETEVKSESKADEYSDCWPRDWLCKDVPGVRVIAVNYTTDILWRPLWIKKRNRTNMVERSMEMIEELQKLGVGKRPIIWVGHSKGGLFIKQILVSAWENSTTQPDLEDIYSQTRAIMFYSVPHRGSFLADYTLPFLRKSVELTEVQRNCEFVLNLHDKFLKIFGSELFSPEIYSIIETSFTLMSFVYVKIVAFDSADPGIGTTCGFPVDHREICKPSSRDCFLYVELVKLIKRVLQIDL